MKKIIESWNDYLNEDRINEDRIRIFSTQCKFVLKKPEGASAVIDDTLALIRAIPDVTVVNSLTDKLRTTERRAYIDLEFKFVPRSTSIKNDLKNLREEILGVSNLVVSVSPARFFMKTLRRVQ